MADRFRRDVDGACIMRRSYEDRGLQAKALVAVPSARLLEQAGMAHVSLPLAPGVGDPAARDALVKELMRWFKEDFFTWVNTIPCEGCGKETQGVGTTAPLDDERRYNANTVELYECKDPLCGAWSRFPRYNEPGKLLETRRGRCGEWANCFALIARAFGFEVRLIRDWTDHVWVEIWSEHLDRWVSADACEGPGAFDTPHMYESGWGKKLNYIVAVGLEHVVDVTRRYTKDFAGKVAPNRRLAPESHINEAIGVCHRVQEVHALNIGWTDNQGILKTRERLIIEQLSFLDVSSAELQPAEQSGRISGSAEWRRLRGEDGSQEQ